VSPNVRSDFQFLTKCNFIEGGGGVKMLQWKTSSWDNYAMAYKHDDIENFHDFFTEHVIQHVPYFQAVTHLFVGISILWALQYNNLLQFTSSFFSLSCHLVADPSVTVYLWLGIFLHVAFGYHYLLLVVVSRKYNYLRSTFPYSQATHLKFMLLIGRN
jgi:hypothetical protein